MKCSTLQGKKTKTVYSPSGGRYIGWIEPYNHYIIFSMNSGIYKMGFVKRNPVLLRKVDEREESSKADKNRRAYITRKEAPFYAGWTGETDDTKPYA